MEIITTYSDIKILKEVFTMKNVLILTMALFFILNLNLAVSFAAHEVNVDQGEEFSISLDTNPSLIYEFIKK